MFHIKPKVRNVTPKQADIYFYRSNQKKRIAGTIRKVPTTTAQPRPGVYFNYIP